MQSFLSTGWDALDMISILWESVKLLKSLLCIILTWAELSCFLSQICTSTGWKKEGKSSFKSSQLILIALILKLMIILKIPYNDHLWPLNTHATTHLLTPHLYQHLISSHLISSHLISSHLISSHHSIIPTLKPSNPSPPFSPPIHPSEFPRSPIRKWIKCGFATSNPAFLCFALGYITHSSPLASKIRGFLRFSNFKFFGSNKRGILLDSSRIHSSIQKWIATSAVGDGTGSTDLLADEGINYLQDWDKHLFVDEEIDC